MSPPSRRSKNSNKKHRLCEVHHFRLHVRRPDLASTIESNLETTMSRSGLFLDPEAHQALVRQAQAERSALFAQCLQSVVARMLRTRPPTQSPTTAPLPERVRALLERYWALPATLRR
jgi:hypothetical protein